MKWLALAAVLVGAVWLWSIQPPERSAPVSSLSTGVVPSVQRELLQSTQEPVTTSQTMPRGSDKGSDLPGIESDAGGVINIGEPMDPDDPSTWPQPENTEVTNIGEPMDPDDPSTWPQPESTEVINIGEPMDPDDPSTWPLPETTEVINIGEPMDPDDPTTWPQSEKTEVINIGEPMDPDDPSTW